MDIVLMTRDEMLKLPDHERKIALKQRAEWLDRQRQQERKESNLRYRKIDRFINRDKHIAYMKMYRLKVKKNENAKNR
jgi:hypothetical protein